MSDGRVGSVGHTNGEMQETELRALANLERSGDGTLSMTRAESAAQEMIRGGEGLPAPVTRTELLSRALRVPPILRGWSITPLDDRVLVRYASFREGYVCETCDGAGHGEETCPRCLGLRKIVRSEGWKPEDCPDCRIVGAENQAPSSCGKVPCAVCNGSGLANGVLAIPDSSKQDHSYGDILAVGTAIRDLAIGDRVLFSKMGGIYIRGDVNCCLLRRGEIMGFMSKPRKA